MELRKGFLMRKRVGNLYIWDWAPKIKTSTYKQIQCKKLIDSIIIKFQLTQMSYVINLIYSPVKPAQLIGPSLT